MSIREILKKAVGHGIDERKIECDCLWCRKGGTFDQATQAILAEVERMLPEQENLEELKPIASDDYACQAEASRRMGYNQAIQDMKAKLEKE